MDLSEMVAVFFFHASTPVNNFVYISVIFIAFDNMNTTFECYANNYDHSDKIAMESIFFLFRMNGIVQWSFLMRWKCNISKMLAQILKR